MEGAWGWKDEGEVGEQGVEEGGWERVLGGEAVPN